MEVSELRSDERRAKYRGFKAAATHMKSRDPSFGDDA